MKQNINSLIGSKVAATNGELGEVKDIYFDDATWTIRYFIIETGSWLESRKVLISPQSVVKGSIADSKIAVNLTTEQIKNSPDIDTNLPVARQQREVLHRHHAWENYWDNNFFGGGTKGDTIPAADFNDDPNMSGYDPHLQSAMRVSGYRIHALDGEIGHLNNYIIDDETWIISKIVVDTARWIGGKKVLVPVSHVDAVQWYNYEVFLNIKTDEVENSPLYNAEMIS